jgi:hypothetical protein
MVGIWCLDRYYHSVSDSYKVALQSRLPSLVIIGTACSYLNKKSFMLLCAIAPLCVR